jgi:hypothetical protein
VSRTRLGALSWLFGCLAACGSPIVGGECRPGFVICDGACVDLDSDPAHCGACGRDCGAFACSEGMCTREPRDPGTDGGGGVPRDGGVDGGMSGDPVQPPPGTGSSGSSVPLLPDGGFAFPDPRVEDGCAIGQTECGTRCADLQSDRDSCGACAAMCGAGQFCIAGRCEDECDPPLTRCGAQCVDLESDEQHCGGCGVVCFSGLCESGVCTGAVPGHLVVIGHDYAGSANAAMQRVAGNALFLASGAPVRAIVYRGAVQTASAQGVTRAFDAVAAATGRTWTEALVDPDRVPERLIEADAFIVHAQRGASDAELAELGRRWGLAMAQFLLRGGIVVLFETLSSSNRGTFQVLEPAGLFTATGRESTRGTLQIVEFGDSVATQVTPMYQSQPTTVRFTGVAEAGGVVVQDAAGEAVVVHRTAVAP